MWFGVFPLIEDLNSPGPKARPGLVRRALLREDRPYIEVTYGTSNTARRTRLGLYVATPADLLAIGLPRATMFDLERTIILPWAAEWFGTRSDGTGPVIGSLNARMREYLNR